MAGIIVLVSGPPLLSWPLLVGVIAGTVVAAITDGMMLLQLAAETTGAIRKAPRTLRSSRRGDKDKAITAGVIEPGMWVCNCDDYEALRSEAEHEYRQRLEEHEHREDERIAIARELWLEQKKADAKRGIAYVNHYRPPELDRQPFYGSKHVPKKKFRLVMVAHPSGDAKTVSLGVLYGASENFPADEKFYVRRPKTSPTIDDEQNETAATALVDMLKILQSEPATEEEVILLLQEHYNLGALRWAIRGALATNLIKRHRDPVRLLCEIICLFRLASSRTAERRRKITLTELGQMWIAADRAARVATARCPETEDTKGKPMTHNEYHFYGDPTFRDSPVGSTIHHGPHTEIHLDVKDVLVRTIETFDARRDRIRATSDPEALEEAISKIRSVLEGKQPADSRIAPALRVITRIGEGLFLGVAGNALYGEILQLIQILSK